MKDNKERSLKKFWNSQKWIWNNSPQRTQIKKMTEIKNHTDGPKVFKLQK